MKAIIPVAGAGTRLRPHTYTQPKALIPVAGKPILAFMIDDLLEAGVEDFIFIIGYMGEKIRDFIAANYSGLNARFIEQEQREGLGHAVLLAKQLCEPNEKLLILLGDSVFDIDLKEIINVPYSILGIKKVEDPRYFGVALLDEQDNVTKVIEKPQIPVSNLALIGLYKINDSDALFDALEYNISNNIRTGNAFQLTDALMRMIEKGIHLKAYKVNNWFDCGQKESLLNTNTLLLRKRTDIKNEFLSFQNSVIIHPVAIGKSCNVTNSIIGTNVTLGENTTIEDSIIKDSIIGSYSNIKNEMLHRSVVGSDVIIIGKSKSLNIGDDTEIDLRT